MSWSHRAGQIALNPSSCGWGQSGVWNWHLRQAWRLAPVSRSICCTAIRLHLCIQSTCVSWITFKLIWGLCWTDSPAQWGLTEAIAKATRKLSDPFQNSPTYTWIFFYSAMKKSHNITSLLLLWLSSLSNKADKMRRHLYICFRSSMVICNHVQQFPCLVCFLDNKDSVGCANPLKHPTCVFMLSSNAGSGFYLIANSMLSLQSVFIPFIDDNNRRQFVMEPLSKCE